MDQKYDIMEENIEPRIMWKVKEVNKTNLFEHFTKSSPSDHVVKFSSLIMPGKGRANKELREKPDNRSSPRMIGSPSARMQRKRKEEVKQGSSKDYAL